MKNMLGELYKEKSILIQLLKNLGNEVNDLCKDTNLIYAISIENGDMESLLCNDIYLLSKRVEHINFSIGIVKHSLLFINGMIKVQEKYLIQNQQI